MCWFVARKSFCQLEREFIMGISTSNHKIKKQDEAMDNKRLVSLGFQMCQCCFPPPLLLLWSRGKGPGARLLPAAAHRVKITSNEPRHKWQLMRNLHNNCLHQILGKQEQHCTARGILIFNCRLIKVYFMKKFKIYSSHSDSEVFGRPFVNFFNFNQVLQTIFSWPPDRRGAGPAGRRGSALSEARLPIICSGSR